VSKISESGLLDADPSWCRLTQLFPRYAEQMVTQKWKSAILVCQTSLTPSANKALTVLHGKYQFEVFEEADLVVNITKHVLVPRHEVLTAEEKRVLLDR